MSKLCGRKENLEGLLTIGCWPGGIVLASSQHNIACDWLRGMFGNLWLVLRNVDKIRKLPAIS